MVIGYKMELIYIQIKVRSQAMLELALKKSERLTQFFFYTPGSDMYDRFYECFWA